MDESKVVEFVGKAVGDLGSLLTGSMVVVGDRLGLYRATAGAGPLAPAELAQRTGTTERYVREWLCAQAAAGYLANLVSSWIPALDGVEKKLRAGARAADVGCGCGASTLILAEAFPASTFVGFDAHEPSVDTACKRAADASLAGRVRFEVATAKDFPGRYDLVAFFDCLHDMGDPAGACAHVRAALEDDGALMVVEPYAGDRVEDNLNPVGAVYYAASTLLCTPSSRSQEVGAALGAQAGEARLGDVVTGAGFRSLRRAAETPFNLVLEARP